MSEPGVSRVLKIEISADGQARVDGTLVPANPDLSLDELRAVALRSAVTVAAAAGTALRVDARDPEGVWQLVVHPSGQVEDRSASSTKAPTAGLVAAEDVSAEATPPEYREALAAIVEASTAGRVQVAEHLAKLLEKQVEAEVGEGSARWVRVREVRAHLAVCRGDLAAATEQWVQVALAWVQLGQPECWAAARNATYCWHWVQDVEDAVRVGEQVARMWRQAGREKQARNALLRIDQLRIGSLR